MNTPGSNNEYKTRIIEIIEKPLIMPNAKACVLAGAFSVAFGIQIFNRNTLANKPKPTITKLIIR